MIQFHETVGGHHLIDAATAFFNREKRRRQDFQKFGNSYEAMEYIRQRIENGDRLIQACRYEDGWFVVMEVIK